MKKAGVFLCILFHLQFFLSMIYDNSSASTLTYHSGWGFHVDLFHSDNNLFSYIKLILPLTSVMKKSLFSDNRLRVRIMESFTFNQSN